MQSTDKLAGVQIDKQSLTSIKHPPIPDALSAKQELCALLAERTVTEFAIVDHNYCDRCGVPAQLVGIEYVCAECNQLTGRSYECATDYDNVAGAHLRIGTGTHKGRIYNTLGNSHAQKHRAIINKLLECRRKYKDREIVCDILETVANQYNAMQKLVIGQDENGKDAHFVKRSRVCNEILAALIHYECISRGEVYSDKQIAIFMGLETEGFANGKRVLEELVTAKLIDITLSVYDARIYASCYLKRLLGENASMDRYIGFARELVDESERLKIAVKSQISSKVVGAIAILIDKCKLATDKNQLEICADNIKRNTYMRFYEIIFSARIIDLFSGIFAKYNIPLY